MKEQLVDSIGLIDDEMIEEVRKYRAERINRSGYIRRVIGITAACLAVIAGTMFIIMPSLGKTVLTEPTFSEKYETEPSGSQARNTETYYENQTPVAEDISDQAAENEEIQPSLAGVTKAPEPNEFIQPSGATLSVLTSDFSSKHDVHLYYDIPKKDFIHIEIPEDPQNVDPNSFAFGFETFEPSEAMRAWVQSLVDSGELLRICFASGFVAADGSDNSVDKLIITKPCYIYRVVNGEFPASPVLQEYETPELCGECFVIYKNQVICGFSPHVNPDGSISVGNSSEILNAYMNQYCHDDLNRRFYLEFDGITQPKQYFLLPNEGSPQYHESQDPVMMTFICPDIIL